MIDLEKEREDFESYMNRNECEKDEIFESECNGWIARAESAQEEIAELKEALENIHKALTICRKKWHKLFMKKCEENKELKAKLAKYESKDVVVVPRVPTKEMLDAGFLCGYGSSTREPYKAMIEVGEIK